MATATLISPSAPYHTHAPVFSSYPPPPNSNMPGMLSPAESRRTSDDAENHRQSLPSIQEVIKGAKPNGFAPSIPTTMSGPPSLPSPFTSSTPRPFPDMPHERHPSPGTLHGSASLPRSEVLPGFADPARPIISGRGPAPPLNTFSGPHPSPPIKMEGHDAERRLAEGHRLNGGFSQPQSAQIPYPPPGQLPPGQLPLSAYPISPRHGGPPLHSPFDSQQGSMHPDDGDFARNRDPKYEQAVNRHFQAWSYAEYLAKVCKTVC